MCVCVYVCVCGWALSIQDVLEILAGLFIFTTHWFYINISDKSFCLREEKYKSKVKYQRRKKHDFKKGHESYVRLHVFVVWMIQLPITYKYGELPTNDKASCGGVNVFECFALLRVYPCLSLRHMLGQNDS